MLAIHLQFLGIHSRQADAKFGKLLSVRNTEEPKILWLVLCLRCMMFAEAVCEYDFTNVDSTAKIDAAP